MPRSAGRPVVLDRCARRLVAECPSVAGGSPFVDCIAVTCKGRPMRCSVGFSPTPETRVMVRLTLSYTLPGWPFVCLHE